MSTNMQHQMRYLGSIPVSVTIPNLDSQHSVTAANASHMPCSTYTSGAHSSRQLPWTVSAIPMTEDNSNSVCGIGDGVPCFRENVQWSSNSESQTHRTSLLW